MLLKKIWAKFAYDALYIVKSTSNLHHFASLIFYIPSVPSSEIIIYLELFSYVIGYTVCNLTFVGAEEFKIVQIHFKFFKEYLAVENYC